MSEAAGVKSEEKDGGAFVPKIPVGISKRKLVLPVVIFLTSLAAYSASVAIAVLATRLDLKILFAVLAGVFIANLAIIGHDAVHRSFTRSRPLNRLIGTLAFLPALHPYSRWEYHHNRVHHIYTAQIGVDNAYSPMTPDQYRAASLSRRLYYRFMRSLAGQPFFYMVDIWLPYMFFPMEEERKTFTRVDWLDQGITYVWFTAFLIGLSVLSFMAHGGSVAMAIGNGVLFGFLIPFLIWNLFIAFVTIVQHTSPKVHWILPTGRPSTYEQKLRGTVHVGFPEVIDWFFHRVMQHIAHHVNPVIPLYVLKGAEKEVIADAPEPALIERWTPLYHWRMTRDCKLYDPVRDCWCAFDFQPSVRPVAVSATPVSAH